MIVVIVIVLQLLAYRTVEHLAQASDRNRHSLEVLLETERIATSVLQIQTATRGFMLTGNEAVVGPMAQEERLGLRHLQRALALTSDNAAQHERLVRLTPLFENWMREVIWPLIEKRRAVNKTVGVSQQVATSADVLNGAKTVASIRALISDVAAEESALLQARRRESLQIRAAGSGQLFGGGATAILLAVLIAALLTRAILRPVDTLYRAVTDIATGKSSARANVLSNDELGRVTHEFNRMAQSIEDNHQALAENNEQLRRKVNSLLGVVSQAAAWNFTGQIDVVGEDPVGKWVRPCRKWWKARVALSMPCSVRGATWRVRRPQSLRRSRSTKQPPSPRRGRAPIFLRPHRKFRPTAATC